MSLAQALSDRLTPDYTVDIVDPQSDLICSHYRLVSRHAQWLWGAEFRLIDTPRRSAFAHKVFTRLFAGSIRETLERSRPDVVITTHPLLTVAVMDAMNERGLRCPLILMFADPGRLHHSWLTERRAAVTFAPTADTYRQALDAGFHADRLHLTGWPVRRQFHEVDHRNRPSTLVRLGLDPDRFTVLLQGGGEGAAKFARIARRLLAVPALQVLVAAGTNQSLPHGLGGLDRVRVVPFTNEFAKIMNAADVVMGKAGPNTLFEAATLAKPFIATSYIPGQEQPNLRFIDRNGLGWIALQAREQLAILSRLASDADARRAATEAAGMFSARNEVAARNLRYFIDSALSHA